MTGALVISGILAFNGCMAIALVFFGIGRRGIGASDVLRKVKRVKDETTW